MQRCLATRGAVGRHNPRFGALRRYAAPPDPPPGGAPHDVARCESYLVSCQDVLVDEVRQTRIRAGRYIDRFERRDGEWKLADRTMIDEWARIDAVGEAIEITGHSGRPAPDDISYQR